MGNPGGNRSCGIGAAPGSTDPKRRGAGRSALPLACHHRLPGGGAQGPSLHRRGRWAAGDKPPTYIVETIVHRAGHSAPPYNTEEGLIVGEKEMMDRLLGCLRPRVSRAMLPAVLSAALFAVACSSDPPFTLEASGPYAYSAEYPAVVNLPAERVAILVTITNRSGDDLSVSPADFVARDSDHRIYPANPTETAADAVAVRVASKAQGMGDAMPLPAVTLRQNDVISGFVVFDVPAGVRPVDLIWRQTDTDSVVALSSGR